MLPVLLSLLSKNFKVPSTILAVVAVLAGVFYAGWRMKPQQIREVPRISSTIVEKWQTLPSAPSAGGPIPQITFVYQPPSMGGYTPPATPIIIERPAPDIARVIVPEPLPDRPVWPQTITVRVGGVLTVDGAWVTPKNPDLRIGMVAPGLYGAIVQEGWKTERVITDTRVEQVHPRTLMFAAYSGWSTLDELVAGLQVRQRMSASADLVLQHEWRHLGTPEEQRDWSLTYQVEW